MKSEKEIIEMLGYAMNDKIQQPNNKYAVGFVSALEWVLNSIVMKGD